MVTLHQETLQKTTIKIGGENFSGGRVQNSIVAETLLVDVNLHQKMIQKTTIKISGGNFSGGRPWNPVAAYDSG